jgi:hypothetical protein
LQPRGPPEGPHMDQVAEHPKREENQGHDLEDLLRL